MKGVGVLQVSLLGLLLLHIFLCDLFLVMNKTDFAKYVDKDTSYTIGNIEDVFQLFFDNKIWTKANKYHFICSSTQKYNLAAGLLKYYMLKLISDTFKVPSYEYMCKY